MKKDGIGLGLLTIMPIALSGCMGGYGYNNYQRSNSYSHQRNNYEPNLYQRNHGRYYNAERREWRRNAYVSPVTFRNSRQIQRHILDETRGANFNNARDRRHAQERALQIKERAWNRQVKQWNRQLERQGYKRHRTRN